MSAEAWDMNIDKIRLAEVTKDTGSHSQNIEACQEIERLSRLTEAQRHRIHVGLRRSLATGQAPQAAAFRYLAYATTLASLLWSRLFVLFSV